MIRKIKQSRLLASNVRRAVSQSLTWEVILAATAFPASILLNRALGAEDRGLLALVALIPTTFFVLGSCQWDRLVKGLLTSGKMSSAEAWRVTKHYTFRLTLIFLPISILCGLIYTAVPWSHRWMSVVYSFTWPVYFLAGSLGAIFLASSGIAGQYWMRVGLQGSYLVILIGMFLTRTVSVFHVILAYFFMQIISLAFGLFMRKKLLSGAQQSANPSFKPLVKGFFPFAMETFSTKADTWAFSFFSNVASLGSYAAITALLLPLNLLSSSLLTGATATLNWKNHAAVRSYLIKSAVLLSGFAALIGAGGFFGGAWVIGGILGKSFALSAWMIPWIAAIVLANACANQFHMALQLSGRQDSYLLIQTAEPVARLSVVLLLGWGMGTIGIFMAMILISLLKSVACGCWMHKG
ncbi:MAG: hypothetical protein V1746_02865 [bacterium]